MRQKYYKEKLNKKEEGEMGFFILNLKYRAKSV